MLLLPHTASIKRLASFRSILLHIKIEVWGKTAHSTDTALRAVLHRADHFRQSSTLSDNIRSPQIVFVRGFFSIKRNCANIVKFCNIISLNYTRTRSAYYRRRPVEIVSLVFRTTFIHVQTQLQYCYLAYIFSSSLPREPLFAYCYLEYLLFLYAHGRRRRDSQPRFLE